MSRISGVVVVFVLLGCGGGGDGGDHPLYPSEEPSGAPPAGIAAGIFGEWTEVEDLPAFNYTLAHLTDDRAEYDVTSLETSRLNWHQIGNDETMAIAANDGWVQLYDFSHGPLWLNYYDENTISYAGGFGYVREGSRTYSTLYRDAPEGALTRRVFGTGFFDTAQAYDGLEVSRRVMMPYGRATYLLNRVTIRNQTEHRRRFSHFEYWDVRPVFISLLRTWAQRRNAGAEWRYRAERHGDGLIANEESRGDDDAEDGAPLYPDAPGPTIFLLPLGDTPVDGFTTDVLEFFGDGGREEPDAVVLGELSGNADADDPCFVLQSDVELEPGGERTLWFMYGYTHDDLPDAPDDPAEVEASTLESWRQWLPVVDIGDESELERELRWHAYYLRSSTRYDAFYGRQSIPQAGAYIYEMGFNANARDTLQHAMPMIYFEPAIARDSLLTVMQTTDPDGEVPYSLHGYGLREALLYAPSDVDIYPMWFALEYVFATRDFDFLDEDISYYPPGSEEATVWEHLVNAYRHLVDVVGRGVNGLIHIRNSDWNDGLIYEAGEMALWESFIADGESTLVTAQAAWVLPRFAELARLRGDDELADEAETFRAEIVEAMQGYWLGEWFARATLGDGSTLRPERLWLEPQPWAVLSGIATDEQTETLLDSIDEHLRDGAPIGTRIVTPPEDPPPAWGEGTLGGVWGSINHTLIWASASVRPEFAWDEFQRNTLIAHTEAYPEIWTGVWSGPDSYNSGGAREGWTTDVIFYPGQRTPIQNAHTHSQPLLSALRLMGVNPTIDGLTIDPAIPGDSFSIETPEFGLAYAEDSVEGHAWTGGESIEVHIRAPSGLASGDVVLESTSATSDWTRAGDFIDVTLDGPEGSEWRWSLHP